MGLRLAVAGEVFTNFYAHFQSTTGQVAVTGQVSWEQV